MTNLSLKIGDTVTVHTFTKITETEHTDKVARLTKTQILLENSKTRYGFDGHPVKDGAGLSYITA